MCINICCENSKCEHYFEDMCLKHCNNETIHLNEFGICSDFKLGTNESYLIDSVGED